MEYSWMTYLDCYIYVEKYEANKCLAVGLFFSSLSYLFRIRCDKMVWKWFPCLQLGIVLLTKDKNKTDTAVFGYK